MRRKFIKTVLAMGAAAGALPGLGMRSLRAQPTATVSGKPIEWVVGFAAGAALTLWHVSWPKHGALSWAAPRWY